MTKIAISLPNEVFEAIERERESTGESRSEFLRRAVELLLRQKEEREAEEQYARGYQEFPESVEDLGGLLEIGLAVLAQEPWDGEGNTQ